MFLGNYPLDVSDGAETYLGLSNAGLVRRYPKPGGPPGGSFYETRALSAASAIAASVKVLSVGGFGAAGDGGHAFYKRLNAHPYTPWAGGASINMSAKHRRNSTGLTYRLVRRAPGNSTVEPTHTIIGQIVQGADGYRWIRENPNPGWFRSLDTFKFDGTSDATDGGWWALVPTGGGVNLENFGGKADANYLGAGGADNFQPVLDAIHYTSWSFISSPYSYTIQLPAGNLRFSAGFDIHTICHIRGVWGTGQYQGGTALFFPQTVDPFIYGNDATEGATTLTSGLGESAGSVLENVSIWGGGGLGIFTDPNRTMIRLRTQVSLRNYSLYGIPGRGVYIIAGGGDGDANNWHSENAYIHEAGSDYWKVQGSDTNGGYCKGLVTHGQGGRGGAGIIETGGLGCNVYIGLQITGYGNLGVRHTPTGGLYTLIDDRPGIGSSTTPGSNDLIWMWTYPDTISYNPVQFPEWNAANTYTVQCPVYCTNNSRFVGPYCEGSAIAAHITGGGYVDGGNLPLDRYSNSMNFAGGAYNNSMRLNQAMEVIKQWYTGSAEQIAQGDYTEVGMGHEAVTGTLTVNGGVQFLRHRRQKDSSAYYEMGYRGPDIQYGIQGLADIWRISGFRTARNYGRAAPVPHIFGLHDFAIHDATDSNFARIFSSRSARPTGGSHAKGEWTFVQHPAQYGSAAWVCTVDGTPGSYGTIPVFGLTSVTAQNIGELVVECTSNTQLKFKYRGSDGVERSASLTLA